MVERAVQTLKMVLKKSQIDLEDHLYRFLARYRVTPQSTTRQTPADLVMKFKPHTRLDLVMPSIQQKVLQRKDYNCQRDDSRAGDHQFYVGDPVWAYNFQGGPKWRPGVLENRVGPVNIYGQARGWTLVEKTPRSCKSSLP